MIRRPPRTALLPYATLFRTKASFGRADSTTLLKSSSFAAEPSGATTQDAFEARAASNSFESSTKASSPSRAARSEEHTSELQSRQYLVCRLLLEQIK